MRGDAETGLPRHVAVIMDGNGRWAQRRLLPRSAGHRAGMNRMLSLVDHMFQRGVKYVTLYALSTENLSRPKEELDGLYSLIRRYFAENTRKLKEKSVRLKVIGERALLPDDVRVLIEEGERETAEGERGVLLLAIAYGSRQELIRAVNRVKHNAVITEEDVSAALDTAGVPEPDLLIRTGKELRLSNFLLWQAAYAELYFSGKMFPDFTNRDLDKALEEFKNRHRRYGLVE